MEQEKCKLPNSAHDAEATYLIAIFSRLKAAGISYAVMRNYELLPASTNGSDLDILVPDDERSGVEKIIELAAEQAGGATIGIVRTAGFVKINALGKLQGHDDTWWGLRVDIHLGLKFNGYADLLSKEVLNARTIQYNGIYVLPGDLAAVLGVLKEVLYNGIVPSRYIKEARKAFESNRRRLGLDLEPIGARALQVLVEICEQAHHGSVLEEKINKLRTYIVFEAQKRSLVNCIRFRAYFFYSKLARMVNPPGKIIALSGGSNEVREAIVCSMTPVISRATHGDFRVDSPKGEITPSPHENDGACQSLHKSDHAGKTLSILKQQSSIIINYWFKTRTFLARSPSIVVYNGYPVEDLRGCARLYFSVKRIILKLAAYLTPCPDIVVRISESGQFVGCSRNIKTDIIKHNTSDDDCRDVKRLNSEKVLSLFLGFLKHAK